MVEWPFPWLHEGEQQLPEQQTHELSEATEMLGDAVLAEEIHKCTVSFKGKPGNPGMASMSKNQEEPGGARRSHEELGGARRSQEEP